MRDLYLSTDEQLDVLISLREALHQVQRVLDEPQCWKWAIVALVSATNGALTCNLTGTMLVGALKKPSRNLMINALQHATRSQGLSDLPEVYLEAPMKLLDMVSNTDRFDPGSGPCLCISQDQRSAFEHLIVLRNAFMHFQPQSLSIAISDLPPTFLLVIGIVKAIAADGHSLRHLCEESREEVSTTCDRLEQALKSIEKGWASGS